MQVFTRMAITIVSMEEVNAYFLPVLTFEEYLEVRNVLAQKSSFNPVSHSEVMFRRMVTCDYCGGLMSPTKTMFEKFVKIPPVSNGDEIGHYTETDQRFDKNGMATDGSGIEIIGE